MTKDELLEKLKALAKDGHPDPEQAHVQADDLLLAWINDPDIAAAYDAVPKWYA